MTSPDEQVIEALKYLGGYIKSHKEDGVTLGNKNAWGSDTFYPDYPTHLFTMTEKSILVPEGMSSTLWALL